MALTHVHRVMEIAPFTVIPYKPKMQKPSNRSDHNRPSRPLALQPSSLKSSQGTDSTKSVGASPENRWPTKDSGDHGVAAGNAVGLVNDPDSAEGPAKHADALPARNDLDDDSDDEFPSVRRLLSPEYKWKLVEERSLLKEGTAEKNAGEAMDDLFGFASIAGSSQDEPIVLGSDDGAEEDGSNDLDNTRASITLDGGQVGIDVLDLEIASPPFSRSASKVEDGDSDGDSDEGGDIEDRPSPRGVKRQKVGSPCCEFNLRDTSTPLFPLNEDGECSTADACGSSSDKPGGDRFMSKRRKLSDSLGSMTTSSSAKAPHPLTLGSGESGDDVAAVPASLPLDDDLAGTARTTPEISVCASLRKPELSPEPENASQDWEVREVIGREYVDGVLHYMVEWCPTLQPIHSLEHAKELVDEFEARLGALRKIKEGRGGQMILGGDVPGGQQKKGRGRPRKQR